MHTLPIATKKRGLKGEVGKNDVERKAVVAGVVGRREAMIVIIRAMLARLR
jgi:hypothetical protein